MTLLYIHNTTLTVLYTPYVHTLTDESTEVEQQAQEVISCIENILGESIQHYF